MVVADPYHANERHDARLVPFQAGDGLELNLVHVRGERDATRGPVLLVHGAGVRANLFNAPVPTTVVDALLERGYDVWLENWRASIDVPANEWTLDQAAIHDHPAAVRKVVEETGAEKVKAIIHCQGSTSFMMSALAGLVPEVDTVVANAVSLHTVIPPVSQVQDQPRSCRSCGRSSSYLDPQWGNEAPDLRAKAMLGFVKLTHHECRQRRLPAGQLHLRDGLADAVAAREPERRDARVDQGRVRGRAADLLPADGALRARRATWSRSRGATSCLATSPPSRLRPTRASSSSPARGTGASCR